MDGCMPSMSSEHVEIAFQLKPEKEKTTIVVSTYFADRSKFSPLKGKKHPSTCH